MKHVCCTAACTKNLLGVRCMAVMAPAWLSCPLHGCAVPCTAELSPVWLCCPLHVCAVPGVAVLSPAAPRSLSAGRCWCSVLILAVSSLLSALLLSSPSPLPPFPLLLFLCPPQALFVPPPVPWRWPLQGSSHCCCLGSWQGEKLFWPGKCSKAQSLERRGRAPAQGCSPTPAVSAGAFQEVPVLSC